jgi:hypothetical protein
MSLALVQRKSRVGAFIVFSALGAFAISPAAAKSMSSEECTRVQQELTALERQGLQEHVSKGAAWAVENLDSATLEKIETYLKLIEQKRFRCIGVKMAAPKVIAVKRHAPDKNVPLPVRNSRRLKQPHSFLNLPLAKVIPTKTAVKTSEHSTTSAPAKKTVNGYQAAEQAKRPALASSPPAQSHGGDWRRELFRND